jgi:hypothetical protein
MPVSPNREPSPHWSGPPTDNPHRRRQKKEQHPHLHTNKIKIKDQKLERLHSTRLIRRDLEATNSRHEKASKRYGLHPTCSYNKTRLSRIISQIELINMNRLAIYAKHAKVTHAIYEIRSCHDYKIVNAIQEILMTTITLSHVYV